MYTTDFEVTNFLFSLIIDYWHVNELPMLSLMKVQTARKRSGMLHFWYRCAGFAGRDVLFAFSSTYMFEVL